jgi:putative membrane protein
MKNILKIFKSDLAGMGKNFFVLVIAGGLCLLPALYAWFNIYSNWDPYGSTGNIAIAVVNLDEGWTDESGETINMGDDVVESLRQKTSIGWVFLDTQEEAVSGVTAGSYYAAIVLTEKFTYSLYKGMLDNIENPKIIYYVNDKKNAVATKITDSAVSSVQTSINESYVRAVTKRLFEETNTISADMEEQDILEQFTAKLTDMRDTLDDYDAMLTTFIDANSALGDATTKANVMLGESAGLLEQGQKELSDAQEDLDDTADSFTDFNSDITSTLENIRTTLETLDKNIGEAEFDEDVRTLTADVNAIIADAGLLSDGLESLAESLEGVQTGSSLQGTLTAINDVRALADTIADDRLLTDTGGTTEKVVSVIQKSLKNYAGTVKKIEAMYTNQIVPQVTDILSGMSGALESVSGMLTTLVDTLDGMDEVFAGVEGSMDALDMSMTQLLDIIRSASAKLTTVIEQVEEVQDSGAMDILLNLLAGDPETFGEYFSQPVQVQENYIYSIKNYGSGVAPFYTTLAIWVGMTILVSLIKVHAEKEGLDNPRPYELFFGRYLIFLLLSEIQSTIIVLGDLYLLRIQCLYPFEFWLTAAVTSLTFSLVVYSLTIAFGDIGKAVAVVVMVIQIAGSGGTYPIEALPGFFQAVYIFLPFPYAIDAMRECIGGMYQNTYSVCLAQLGLFGVAALVVGLVIRIPFMGLNHFFEERMEDTKMM